MTKFTMKLSSRILMTLLFTMPCLSNHKKKILALKTFDESPRYITNWNQYDLPKPVPVDVLKEIMDKVALYRRDEYCPFGTNECDHVNAHEVTRKIVKDTVKELKNLVGLNNDEAEEGKKNTLRAMKPSPDPFISRLEFPVFNKFINIDVMGDDKQKFLELTNHIKRYFAKPKKLYGASYKHLTVPKNKNKKQIIKSFEPIQNDY